MQFSKPLTQLLISLPSGSWNRTNSGPTITLPALNLDTDSRVILARWTMDVIEALITFLETKSRSILRPKSPMAANLFLLNNISDIEKRVRRDQMMQNVIGSISAAEKEKDALVKRSSRGSTGSNLSTSLFSMPKSFQKAKRAGLDGKNPFNWYVVDSVGYIDGYKDALGHLLDVTYVKGASNRSSGSLSGKEREAVKERFRVRSLNDRFDVKNFNLEFEEIIRVNRGLSVPDPDVRGLVIGEIKRVVIPLYTRFYDKYLLFTNGKD
jgi:exocyst complex component 7